LGGVLVASDPRRRVHTSATSSTAARKAASFALDGAVTPLIFLTNWRDAFRISASVAGGEKLNRFFIFLHISLSSHHEYSHIDGKT
jgi:hypothetical protein